MPSSAGASQPGTHLSVIAGTIRPRVPVLRARASQYETDVAFGLLNLEATLDGSAEGFSMVHARVDGAGALPPAHRAHPVRRMEAAVAIVIRCLEDEAYDWRPIAAKGYTLYYRAVETRLVVGSVTRAKLFVSLEGPGPIPSWYRGMRRLAIAEYLRRLDFSSTQLDA